MKKTIIAVFITLLISCSSTKVEKEIINDFIKNQFINDKYSNILVEEALPRTMALQYYENAYNQRNLYDGVKSFMPNGAPPYSWEIDSVEIATLKQKYKNDKLSYKWKKSNFINHKFKIFPYETLRKRGSSELGGYGFYMSQPLITLDQKHAFLFYRSFAIEIGFSTEKAILLKKVNGIWVESYHYNNVSEIN